MAFTTQQNFMGTIDGTNARELNTIMDRKLDSFQERLKCVKDTLDNTEFFTEYFDEYYNPNASQNDYLSIENNVCKVLENYATYLLNAKDVDKDRQDKFKVYYDESEFRRALRKEQLYSDKGQDTIDFMLANQSNYKKSKTQQIYKKDLDRPDFLGSVLSQYQNFVNMLNESDMTLYRRNKIKGEVQRDMILTKDSLNMVHGYNLRYFSESTQPDLDVFDFANFNHLKGYSDKSVHHNYSKVDGLLKFKFNGDFQNDFQCMLYDLDLLIEKTDLTKREREILNFYRKGLTNVKIADIIGIARQTVEKRIDSAIKKINHKAMELRWR